MLSGGWKSLAMVMSLLLIGCATIIHKGSKQWVAITSTPPGATATVDGIHTTQTPGQLKLKRGKDHIILVEKEGFEPGQAMIDHDMSGWVFGNIILGGLIGLAVDFGTGGAYNLDPDTVNVILKEKPGAVNPPTP